MNGSRHPIHSLCSYLGSFPPHVPRQLIERWVAPHTSVLDPFCGAGTTLLEALLLNRPCVGADLNPLAVAISRAKVQHVDLEEVLYRLSDIAREFPGQVDTDHVPDDLRVIFHARTLAQLCYLRDVLDPDRVEDVFIRAVILGILHGKARKDESSAYLSIDMPNTFSMSPDYVRRFVQLHQLRQIPADVFSRCRERVTWLLRQGSVTSDANALVIQGDATQLPDLLQSHGIRSVGAVVTSPPYLGVLRYGAFNWIRLWFLGYDPKEVDRSLDSTDSVDRYLSFMTSFLYAVAAVLPDEAPVVLVIGDVVERGQHLQLAERVWEEIGELVPFSCVTIEVDDFDDSVKTTRIWGEEKKGRATPLDRILVLKRLPS